MAGGTFDKSVGKVRPGTYINFVGTKQDTVGGGERGTVILPLFHTDYGPAGELLTLSASAPDAAKGKIGYSIYDNDPAGNMLLIREAFKGAATVIVYICTDGKTAASGTGGGLTATAKYKGTRGNALTYSVAENPTGGFDVEIYLDGSKVESYEGIQSADDLLQSAYITFTASGETGLSAVAGVTLNGGEDSEPSNGDVTKFLEIAENASWNCMAFPFGEEPLQAAVKTKIKYLRENMGKGVQAVVPNFSGDYEGIINVTNSYALEDTELTTEQATAYVAGITAGANNTTSNTYKTVDGAIRVVGGKTHEEAVAAIQNGEFFFSVSEQGSVVVEYDINSLVTISNGKDSTYKKNRIIRVMDTFAEMLRNNFPPNKFDNDPDGWDVMEGIGKTILKQFGPRSEGGTGAIKNVDYDNDFLVDRENSTGDQTYFKVGLEPTDSSEKLYFTISTR